MLFTVIIAMFMALSAEGGVGVLADPVYILVATIVVVALSPVPGVVLARSVGAQDLGDPYGRQRAFRRVRIGTIAYQVYLLAGYALILYVIGWPTFLRDGLGIGNWVLVDDLLVLLPFPAMLLLAWMPLYRVDRMLRHGSWTLREYLEFHFRQHVLFILVPFAIVMTASELLVRIPWPAAVAESGAVEVIAAFGMILLYVFLPVALRFIWKTRRMEDGPLRRRLADLCTRARMPCSDILVWETLGGQIVNACVTGLTRLARYVMVTDALMDTLDPLETEAVFAHEIGHVKRHHMAYYMLFAAAFVGLLVLVDPARLETSAGPLAQLVSLNTLVLLASVVLYWGVAFGWVSRRMELEADVYAVELVGETTVFVSALERIAFFSGRSRSAGGWRHFSIAKRTQFLLDCVSDPLKARRFKRTMTLLRAGIIALAVLALVAVVTKYGFAGMGAS